MDFFRASKLVETEVYVDTTSKQQFSARNFTIATERPGNIC